MRSVVCGAVAALALGLVTTSAQGATVTRDYEIFATGFLNSFGTVSPVETVNLKFRLTFDPEVAGGETAEGITLTYANIAIDGGLGFDNVTPSPAFLAIGGLAGGSIYFLPGGSNDVSFSLNNILTDTPTLSSLIFSQAGYRGGFRSSAGYATSVAVPEPGSWALMIMGFGGAGAALRSRRKAALA